MYTLTSKHYTVIAIRIANDNLIPNKRNDVMKDERGWVSCMVVRVFYDKGQVIKKPDQVKVSCPVLKTNGWGDQLVELILDFPK